MNICSSWISILQLLLWPRLPHSLKIFFRFTFIIRGFSSLFLSFSALHSTSSIHIIANTTKSGILYPAALRVFSAVCPFLCALLMKRKRKKKKYNPLSASGIAVARYTCAVRMRSLRGSHAYFSDRLKIFRVYTFRCWIFHLSEFRFIAAQNTAKQIGGSAWTRLFYCRLWTIYYMEYEEVTESQAMAS